MDTRDPTQAAEILDLLLKFFGEGERWIKGRFSDRRGNCCLVGALDFVSAHHAIRSEAAERYLADAISNRGDEPLRCDEDRAEYARLRAALRRALRGEWYHASEAVLRRDSFPILMMAVMILPSCGPLLSRLERQRCTMRSPG